MYMHRTKIILIDEILRVNIDPPLIWKLTLLNPLQCTIKLTPVLWSPGIQCNVNLVLPFLTRFALTVKVSMRCKVYPEFAHTHLHKVVLSELCSRVIHQVEFDLWLYMLRFIHNAHTIWTEIIFESAIMTSNLTSLYQADESVGQESCKVFKKLRIKLTINFTFVLQLVKK